MPPPPHWRRMPKQICMQIFWCCLWATKNSHWQHCIWEVFCILHDGGKTNLRYWTKISKKSNTWFVFSSQWHSPVWTAATTSCCKLWRWMEQTLTSYWARRKAKKGEWRYLVVVSLCGVVDSKYFLSWAPGPVSVFSRFVQLQYSESHSSLLLQVHCAGCGWGGCWRRNCCCRFRPDDINRSTGRAVRAAATRRIRHSNLHRRKHHPHVALQQQDIRSRT